MCTHLKIGNFYFIFVFFGIYAHNIKFLTVLQKKYYNKFYDLTKERKMASLSLLDSELWQFLLQ